MQMQPHVRWKLTTKIDNIALYSHASVQKCSYMAVHSLWSWIVWFGSNCCKIFLILHRILSNKIKRFLVTRVIFNIQHAEPLVCTAAMNYKNRVIINDAQKNVALSQATCSQTIPRGWTQKGKNSLLKQHALMPWYLLFCCFITDRCSGWFNNARIR